MASLESRTRKQKRYHRILTKREEAMHIEICANPREAELLVCEMMQSQTVPHSRQSERIFEHILLIYEREINEMVGNAGHIFLEVQFEQREPGDAYQFAAWLCARLYATKVLTLSIEQEAVPLQVEEVARKVLRYCSVSSPEA